MVKILSRISPVLVLFIFVFALLEQGQSSSPRLTSFSMDQLGISYETDIYTKSEDGKETHQFSFSRTSVRENGELKVTIDSKYKDGRPAALEKIRYKDGRFLRYDLKNFQDRSEDRIEIKGNQVHFEHRRKHLNKHEKDVEELEDRFLIVDQLAFFVQKFWKEIDQKGETLHFRMAVSNRTETVGFKVFKEENLKFNGVDAIKVIMKPSSFFIAMLMTPSEFIYERSGQHRLLQYTGITFLKKPHEGDWTDLYARVLYRYPTEAKK